MAYTIKVVCCECGKILGYKEGGTKPDTISHTYCKKCLKKLVEQIDQLDNDFDSICGAT